MAPAAYIVYALMSGESSRQLGNPNTLKTLHTRVTWIPLICCWLHTSVLVIARMSRYLISMKLYYTLYLYYITAFSILNRISEGDCDILGSSALELVGLTEGIPVGGFGTPYGA